MPTGRTHTLDFTLRHRESGRIFVAELKCELEFENYRYLRLNDPAQLRLDQRPPAFHAFVELARAPTSYTVKVAGKPLTVDGSILIWGAVTHEGCDAVMAPNGFADVLSIEEMLRDLRLWGAASSRRRVEELRDWTSSLFDYLAP